MSTIAVVDVITQYLITFGPLLGDIKKRGFYPPMLDRLSIIRPLEAPLTNQVVVLSI